MVALFSSFPYKAREIYNSSTIGSVRSCNSFLKFLFKQTQIHNGNTVTISFPMLLGFLKIRITYF